jgi:ElaA protein
MRALVNILFGAFMTEWQWTSFQAMGVEALYAMLALRSAVFVVEQQCIYQDIDGLDRQALHLLGWQTSAGVPQLVACVRLLAPGVRYREPSLGRVVCASEVRGHGVGRELMRQALAHARRFYPRQAIRISAQCYLERFYAELGFLAVGEAYDEDGIPHREMLLPPAAE